MKINFELKIVFPIIQKGTVIPAPVEIIKSGLSFKRIKKDSKNNLKYFKIFLPGSVK